MIGNVRERTADWYAPRHEADTAKPCCVPQNSRSGAEEGSYDPRQPDTKIPATSSKAARTYARRTTAAATAPRATRRR